MIKISPEISAKATSVKDANALVDIINEILQYNCAPLIPKIEYPYTLNKLHYWSNPDMDSFFINTTSGKRRKGHRYNTFKIPKKSGGMREISTPAKPLKSILRLVDAWLKCLIHPADCVMGFVCNRSIVTNANCHIGANYIFNIDLKDFFPSISRQRLVRMFMSDAFGFSKTFATFLANLLVMKTFDEDGAVRYVLPQGAPSSPTVTNAVCLALDHRLMKLSAAYGVRYTRYADDMTFSANYNAFAEDGPFRQKLSLIIQQSRFTINEAKTHLAHKGERQEVTGLIVSDRVNIPKKFLRDLRSILYIWEHYGYHTAVRNYVFEHHYCKPSVLIEDSIYGKIMWIRNIKGKESHIYKQLIYKYQRCLHLRTESLSLYYPNNSNEYIYTASVTDFEMQTSIKLTLRKITAKNNQKSFQTKANDKMLDKVTLRGRAISPKGDFDVFISKAAYYKPLSSMQISLCHNSSRGYYWILT